MCLGKNPEEQDCPLVLKTPGKRLSIPHDPHLLLLSNWFRNNTVTRLWHCVRSYSHFHTHTHTRTHKQKVTHWVSLLIWTAVLCPDTAYYTDGFAEMVRFGTGNTNGSCVNGRGIRDTKPTYFWFYRIFLPPWDGSGTVCKTHFNFTNKMQVWHFPLTNTLQWANFLKSVHKHGATRRYV